MLGAIAGDIIGSIYEFNNIKTTDFPLFSPECAFTDDTVLTVALADCILHGGDYTEKMREYCRLYPNAGYGGRFLHWVQTGTAACNSFGNGAAMRISPAGFVFDTLDEVLAQAKRFTEPTHNHPEGIKGAQATAAAIFLARTGSTKPRIREYVEKTFAYNLSIPLDTIRPIYRYNETCQATVPEAITAFLESSDFEDAIRKAVSLGGDSDTLACITGGIAHAFYGGVPVHVERKVYEILDERLRKVTMEFAQRFCP